MKIPLSEVKDCFNNIEKYIMEDVRETAFDMFKE